MAETAWWVDRTVYQIYPRSFQDSNGDGVGDIPGIIARLDHLQWLGIGLIWLSPVFRSPMEDNGYDISDYRDIAPEFGTLADMDRLIAEADARGIGIVMDLVVNHTSAQHPWFLEARRSREAATRDFYIWRDPAPNGGPPDGRRSVFGGPAWEFSSATGQYFFHVFAPGQPDLNWTNPAMRAEIHAMMRWWLDRGIRGFRMDVIDLIGKDVDAGILEAGPTLHPHLQEMHREVLAGRKTVTVGETWSVTPETALLYCGRDRGELSMVFQFQHITHGWHPEHGKWVAEPFDVRAFKRIWNRWQAALAEDGWNALYLSNHDLARQVSRFGDAGRYRVTSAKALATVMHLMRGTPFVYQGEEIGMTNAGFERLEQFRDLETLNLHAERRAAGVSTEEFLRGANANGRDNARTPMQWDASPQAGFTTGEPWIRVNRNFREINVAAAREDDTSVLHHYRRLVALRREHPVIVRGRYVPYLEDHATIFAFERVLDGTRLAVVANLGGAPAEAEAPALAGEGRCLLASHEPRGRLEPRLRLAPWESFALLGASPPG